MHEARYAQHHASELREVRLCLYPKGFRTQCCIPCISLRRQGGLSSEACATCVAFATHVSKLTGFSLFGRTAAPIEKKLKQLLADLGYAPA